MEKNVLIGIHIGTTVCKIVALHVDGKVIYSGSKNINMIALHRNWAEQDPGSWWEAVCEMLREMFRKHFISPDSIAGIGIDGQSWNTVQIGRDGELLGNSMIWMDRRATQQAECLVRMVKEDGLEAVNKNPVDAGYLVPKILWIRENKPEDYRATCKFLQSNSYIAYKLTDQLTQDQSQAYGYHFYNIRDGVLEDALCEKMGIDRAKIPDLCESSDIVGAVTRRAAEETGFREGTPVVAGGLDVAAATLGAGVLETGKIVEQSGQAGAINVPVDEPECGDKLLVAKNIVSGNWIMHGAMVGGGSLRWFREQLGDLEIGISRSNGVSEYKLFEQEASTVPLGSDGVLFLPYLAGERSPIWDENAKGVFFGLTYAKTRAHMIRAIMEGTVFSIYQNIRAIEELGIRSEDMVSIGGSTKSYLWTQIKADVTGKTVRIPASAEIAPPLGAAMLAGIGTGLYENAQNAVKSAVGMKYSQQPDEKRHREYEIYYQAFLDIYQSLKDIFKRMSQIH